jgi:exopolyphosphatase/guanosine-5'-triphosphate,3'-diphosphate pyrophosphatase
MPAIAAIDVGSNAFRLVIANVDAGKPPTILDILREPVRLGQDVFTHEIITEETLERAEGAFLRFRDAIARHGVRVTRAVATSAMREAQNAELCVDRILRSSGIEIDVITPEEEARLIHLAVSAAVKLDRRVAILLDIGGGSTEVTIVEDGKIVSTQSYKMGAVRMLQVMDGKARGERRFHQLVREYVDATQLRIKREIGGKKIDLLVGTGGNIETLGDLRKEHLGRERNTVLSSEDLDQLVRRLQSCSVEDRIKEFKLRPDRADVIVPAAIVLQKIVKLAGVDDAQIPHVGLKDGLLIDMAEELFGTSKRLYRDQVLAAALQLGRKYGFDEQHAQTVLRLAGSVFDQTRPLHGMDLEQRLLLEVAALTHDIGQYIAVTDHHKHSHYLLSASPLVGLTEQQMAVVANIARYHRKSLPKPQHEAFRALSSKDRTSVTKLASLLRLADALDTEHASRVEAVELDSKKPKLHVRLRGEGDLLLEKWALLKKAEMFEQVFSIKVTVDDD